MEAMHVTTASQITVVQRALDSLIVFLVFGTSLLHWASRVALVVSSQIHLSLQLEYFVQQYA